MLTSINDITKCKDEFKNASNPVIMSGMVWYGVAGQGNSFGRKYFLYTSDVITEDTMNVKRKGVLNYGRLSGKPKKFRRSKCKLE